jgi:hypothetical protein
MLMRRRLYMKIKELEFERILGLMGAFDDENIVFNISWILYLF